MDSLVRLRQLHNPEISGFVERIISGYLSSQGLSQTGQLTGAFYPLNENPSGYVNSGEGLSIFLLRTETGLFIDEERLLASESDVLAEAAQQFYPLGENPSGYSTGIFTGDFFLASKLTGYVDVTGAQLVSGEKSFANTLSGHTFLGSRIDLNGEVLNYVLSGTSTLSAPSAPTFTQLASEGSLYSDGQTVNYYFHAYKQARDGTTFFSSPTIVPNSYSSSYPRISFPLSIPAEADGIRIRRDVGFGIFDGVDISVSGTYYDGGGADTISWGLASGFTPSSPYSWTFTGIFPRVIIRSGSLQIESKRTPSNPDISGNTGEFTWDDDNIYLNVGTGWRRTPLSNLNSSPYVVESSTGNFVVKQDTGVFATTGLVESNYYPRANPSGFLNPTILSQSGISLETRTLIADDAVKSLDFQLRTLNDQNEVLVLDWFGNSDLINAYRQWTFEYKPTQNGNAFVTSDEIANFVSNTSTGIFVTTGQTGLITGWTNTNYYPRTNPSGYVTTGQTGDYYPTSNPSGYASSGWVTGNFLKAFDANFATNLVSVLGNWNMSGNFLFNLNSAGTFRVSESGGATWMPIQFDYPNTMQFNTKSGSSVKLTGSGVITNFSLVNCNLNNTGSFITTGQTGAFGGSAPADYASTGWVDSGYYPRTNPSGFVTGSVVRPTETGNFLTASALTPYALSADTGNFVTSDQTGEFALTGWVDDGYYPRTNPSGFVTGDVVRPTETGAFITTGQTGDFGGAPADYASTGWVNSGYYGLSNASGYTTHSQELASLILSGIIFGSTKTLSGNWKFLNRPRVNTTDVMLVGEAEMNPTDYASTGWTTALVQTYLPLQAEPLTPVKANWSASGNPIFNTDLTNSFKIDYGTWNPINFDSTGSAQYYAGHYARINTPVPSTYISLTSGSLNGFALSGCSGVVDDGGLLVSTRGTQDIYGEKVFHLGLSGEELEATSLYLNGKSPKRYTGTISGDVPSMTGVLDVQQYNSTYDFYDGKTVSYSIFGYKTTPIGRFYTLNSLSDTEVGFGVGSGASLNFGIPTGLDGIRILRNISGTINSMDASAGVGLPIQDAGTPGDWTSNDVSVTPSSPYIYQTGNSVSKLTIESGRICLVTPETPTNPDASAYTGELAWDTSNWYVNVGTLGWKKSQLANLNGDQTLDGSKLFLGPIEVSGAVNLKNGFAVYSDPSDAEFVIPSIKIGTGIGELSDGYAPSLDFVNRKMSGSWELDTRPTVGGVGVLLIGEGSAPADYASTGWVNSGYLSYSSTGVVTEPMLNLSDNTTGNVSITKHGFAPKAPNNTTTFLRGDATWASPTAVLGDATYGDITVSSTGTVMTVGNDTITYAKIQNVSDTDKVLGRSTVGAGDVEEIPCTAAGRALIAGADLAAQKALLGMPTVARVVTSDWTETGQSLVDITGLSVALEANSTYTFRVHLIWQSSSTAGIKCGINFSAAGATMEATVLGGTSAAACRSDRLPTLDTAVGAAYNIQTNVIVPAYIDGIIVVGANAGNMTVKALKVTSGTCTVKVGSRMEVTKL